MLEEKVKEIEGDQSILLVEIDKITKIGII